MSNDRIVYRDGGGVDRATSSAYPLPVALAPAGGAPAGSASVVQGQETVLDATLVLDTSAYADGDVLSVVAELASFFPSPAGVRLL